MSLIFKILLIILLAAPVVAYAGFLLIQILQYTGRLNRRDKRREELIRQAVAEMYGMTDSEGRDK